ncbi:erythromycin esterase family protein [Cytobacillus suaedae]|nr:erythromycin esterase family protein [Cytobacillus suaedae]
MKRLTKKYLLFTVTVSFILFIIVACNNTEQSESLVDYSRSNSVGFTIDTSKEDLDFSFLNEVLDDKRIVAIGETSHAVEEFNKLKKEMIKYLHKELGYEVIIFESGYAEAQNTNNLQSVQSGLQLMKRSLYPTWHSNDTLQLFSYISEQNGTNRPLQFDGVDLLPIYNSSIHYSYASWLERWLKDIDENIAELAVGAEDDYANINFKSSELEKKSLVDKYSKVEAFLKDNAEKLDEIYPNTNVVEENIAIINERIHIIENVYTLDYLGTTNTENFNDYHKEFSIRDKYMAERLGYLVNEKYKGKKIILWFANMHLMKNTDNLVMIDEGLKDMFEPMPLTMGSIMSESIKDQTYTIGLYMGEGKTGLSTSLETIQLPVKDKEDDLEWILKQNSSDYVFLDLKEWDHDEKLYTAYYWGIYPYQLMPKEQYDGLMFIKNVSPRTLK